MKELFYNPQVSTCMIFVAEGIGEIYNLLFPAVKTNDMDCFFITCQLSVREYNVQITVIFHCGTFHVNIYGNTILHLHKNTLMINDIIIAMINTQTNIASLKFTHNSVVLRLTGINVYITNPVFASPIQILCRERTIFLYRTVNTPPGRILRSIFRSKPS